MDDDFTYTNIVYKDDFNNYEKSSNKENIINIIENMITYLTGGEN